MKHIFHWFTIILHHNISLTRISTHCLPTWMNIYLTKWQCKPQPTSFLRFQDSLSSSYPKHSLETSFFQLDMTSNITWKNWLVSPTIHLKTSFFRGSILVVTNKRTPMIAIVMNPNRPVGIARVDANEVPKAWSRWRPSRWWYDQLHPFS